MSVIDFPETLLIENLHARLAQITADHRRMIAEVKRDPLLTEYLAQQLLWFERAAENLLSCVEPPAASETALIEQFINKLNRRIAEVDGFLAGRRRIVEAAEANLKVVKDFIRLHSSA